MFHVLLVEDALDYQILVKKALESNCHVSVAGDLKTARYELNHRKFDLLLLDVVLPDGDGFKFCSEVLGTSGLSTMPIILMTGKGERADRVIGWKTGADDYIVKPFDLFEFQARVESRLARSRQRSQQGEVLQKGEIRLNLAGQQAAVLHGTSETSLNLTPNEFKLLHCLMKNQDKVLTRAQLLELVWGAAHVTDRTVDKHISSLRKKLEQHGEQLVTIPGMGYRFTLSRAG